jgi:hypothetical protein
MKVTLSLKVSKFWTIDFEKPASLAHIDIKRLSLKVKLSTKE